MIFLGVRVFETDMLSTNTANLLANVLSPVESSHS